MKKVRSRVLMPRRLEAKCLGAVRDAVEMLTEYGAIHRHFLDRQILDQVPFRMGEVLLHIIEIIGKRSAAVQDKAQRHQYAATQ